MKHAVNIVIGLATLACVAALALSVWPGVLNDLLFMAFLLALLILPVIGIFALIALIVLARKGKLRGIVIPWKRALMVLLILCSTYLLLKFYVPRRVAFALSRSAFATLVAQAPVSTDGGATLNKRLGVYRVDEYAADPRGGVYFRVYRGNDGLGPDCMSYGFAYKPNPTGTPFGAARYRLFHMGNGWYWFRASDDWF